MKYKHILYLFVTGLLFSCQPEIDEYSYSSGSADFSTYVALGNSLTAGYADGALYHSAQMNSFPAILAQQFETVGGGSFTQPVINSEYGLLPGKRKLGYTTDCLGNTTLSPLPDEGQLDNLNPIGITVNNMGIPGAKSGHLLFPGYGNLNPYFGRIASSPTATVVGDAVVHNPTFFTLWIGNNDVLGYATSGGIGDTITSQMFFAGYLDAILQTLTGNGAKGAIANIPDITNIPFFTTVPPNGFVLTQSQADQLNAALGPLGFSFHAGPNYFLIKDPSTQIGFRQMQAGELLLLTVPQDSLKCAYWGGFDPEAMAPKPLESQYVLTLSEIEPVNAAIDGYNATISALAAQYDLALVDFNSVLKDLENGMVTNGDKFTTTYITGNAFSLDGIHMTQKGYAFIANKFIEAINMKYGSNVPMVSTTNYPAVELP